MKTFKRFSKYLVIIILLVVLAGCKKTPTQPTKPKPTESVVVPTPTPSRDIVDEFLKMDLITYQSGDNSKSVSSDITLKTKIDSYVITWTSNSESIAVEGSLGIVTKTIAIVEVDLTATLSEDGVDLKTRVFSLRVVKAETIFILLDSNGGELEGGPMFEIVKGGTLPEVGNPYKEGYLFIGWELNGEIISLDTPFVEGAVITAKYEQMAKITFLLEGGELTEGTAEYVYVAKGETSEVLNDLRPTKEGYIFAGWFIFKNYVLPSTIVEDDMFITARYLVDENIDPIYGNYYNNINATTGLGLIDQLQALISYGLGATGNRNLNYGDARYALLESDVMPGNPGYLWGIYDNVPIVAQWDQGSWQREHVWPNSKLGTAEHAGNSSRDAGSDPHNLRAITPGTNGVRSNFHFADASENPKGYVVPGGMYYPGDEHRGDVARILLYMAVRYRGILRLVETPNEINYHPDYAEGGDITHLLHWHIADPVDDFERNRNQVLFNWQGNRNPFIDKPEYFESVWVQFMEEEVARQNILQTNINTAQQLKINMVLYVNLSNRYENIFN